MDLTLFPTLADIPGRVDLAVVSVPGQAVPAILDACVAKGIKADIVLSAGFSETGEEGKILEDEIVRVLAKGIRVRSFTLVP